MTLGVLSILAATIGMIDFGQYLGPLAIVLAMAGLVVSIKTKSWPILVNIIGIAYGIVACIYSPVLVSVVKDLVEGAKIQAEAPAPLPETEAQTDEPPAAPSQPVQIYHEPIAPIPNARPFIPPGSEPTPEKPKMAPVTTFTTSAAPAPTAQQASAIRDQGGDFGRDVVDILLTLSAAPDAKTGLQPVYIELYNKSDETVSNTGIAIALKDKALWPAAVLAKLKPFDAHTLPPSMQLAFADVPFKDLYDIQIGALPPHSRRKITLNFNPYDQAHFSTNIYLYQTLHGESQPMAERILINP